jgi:hypothetical protein
MIRIAAVVLGGLALAACARVEASTPVPTPSLPCSLPYGTHVALVAPRPGSAAVAPGIATVVLVASHDLPKTVTVVATDARGSASSGALERTVRPAGASRSAFEHAVYYRAAGVTLRAHKHYTVALDDVAQNGCAPYVALGGNARFSTD